MSSSVLKQYLSGSAEIGGGGGMAAFIQSNKTSHAPYTIQDGSPNKKRSCDKQASPISNKKVKEIDTAAVLQSNNNEMKDGASAAKLSTEQITKDIMCNGAPTEQLHSTVSDTSLQLQSKNDEDGSLLSEEVVSKMDKLTNDIQNQNNRQYIKAGETTDNDIYLIRGTDHLPGNKKYNELIHSNKASYQSSNRSGKSAIALSIINELRSQNPPSRFLRIESGKFYDVGDEEVRKKIVSILGKGTRKAKAQRDSTDSNITAISFSDGEEDQPQQSRSLHDICSIAILSQKQFKRSKPTPQKETNNETTVTKSSSPYVEREVSKFLVEEAKHLSPTSQTVIKSREVSPPSQPKSTAAAAQTNSNDQSQLSVMTLSCQAQVDNSHTAPKIAIASEETDTLDAETTSKLPVAFGFNLNDNASKEFAQKATEKWTNEGMKAAESKGVSLRVSIGEGKMISGVPSVTPNVKTPKKPPKTPAILLSTKPAPNLPDGWLVKLFKRQSGATAGSTDKYFYSPDNEIKFRSMKGCRQFIDILDEPNVDSNEAAALKEYKERGYKF